MSGKPIVEIVEQPAEVNERFRYKCEGKSVVIGANSTPSNRTYPSIRLLNYTGTAVVVVSCVTAEKPYRQHPNTLVGKSSCKGGVRTVDFETDASNPTVITFKSIGIQCCKKSDMDAVFAERERYGIDPFKAKFAHKNQKMDLTTVRLCFQVFLRLKPESDGQKIPTIAVPPVVSNVIRDKKFVTEFKVRYISDISSPSTGGKEIVIICDKFSRDDIKIRFYRENADGSVSWEAWGRFEKKDVYHQVAIVFTTPAYEIVDIDEPVDVLMQFVKLSDNWHSEPHYFKYIPDYTNINHAIKRMKRKFFETESTYGHVQRWDEEQQNRRQMEININLNVPVASPLAPNQSNTNGSCQLAEGPVPVSQSNFVSNFSADGAYGNYPVQSNPMQQSHVQDQRFQQSYHPVNCDYYSQHQQMQSNFPQSQSNCHQQPSSHFVQSHQQMQSNFPQSQSNYQQPPSHFVQSQSNCQQPPPSHDSQLQNNQISHGHSQHQQIYPQYQPNFADYPPSSHLQEHLRDDQALNIPIEPTHQSQFNVDCVRHHYPTAYNPLASHQNANQCDSVAQSWNNFDTVTNNKSVQLQPEDQILYDSNFNAQEIIDNMSGSFGSLAIETQ